MVWKYKDTLINNGSTLVDDIDLRNYFHIETKLDESHHSKSKDESLVSSGDNQDMDDIISRSGIRKKSELFLTSMSVDDNGTFACIASNSAGSARANFTLHVVVPLDPPPPLVRKQNITISSNVMKPKMNIVSILNRFVLLNYHNILSS